MVHVATHIEYQLNIGLYLQNFKTIIFFFASITHKIQK
jgi:hypothetical protein